MLNIVIAGVGGQGTLLASRVLGKYALDSGFDCKLSEVHGMAQRGGSVITYVRISQNADEKIYSPIIDEGGADIVLAFEKLEALRYMPYLKKDGIVLYSSQEILPMPVVTGEREYPRGIESELGGTANSVMLGAFCKVLGLDKEKFSAALLSCIPQKTVELNKKAFESGYNAVK